MQEEGPPPKVVHWLSAHAASQSEVALMEAEGVAVGLMVMLGVSEGEAEKDPVTVHEPEKDMVLRGGIGEGKTRVNQERANGTQAPSHKRVTRG